MATNKTPWVIPEEPSLGKAIPTRGNVPNETENNTPVAVWVDLYNALRRNTDYKVVTEYTATHDYGYSEERELCAVHIDHKAKKIELEFE